MRRIESTLWEENDEILDRMSNGGAITAELGDGSAGVHSAEI